MRLHLAVATALAFALLLSGPPVADAHVPRGLQEVPLRDLRSDFGGVCSARLPLLVKNFGPGSTPRAYLDAAQACGAKVLVHFSETIGGGRVYPSRVAGLVRLVKGHPALYGYLTVKEPSLMGISPAEARRLRDAFHRADPSKPVVVLLTELPTVGRWYARGIANIVMFDWYPISPRGYRAGSCATLSHASATVRSRGAAVWIMAQAHQYDAGGKSRPTSSQLAREVTEARSCAMARMVVAHIWSHPSYQSDLRRNPWLFRTYRRL